MYGQPYLHESEDVDLDEITQRYGLPRPCGQPVVSAQIDLDEPALVRTERTTCCCTLHGTLHNPQTCCPVHRQRRPGLSVPPMTPEMATGNPEPIGLDL